LRYCIKTFKWLVLVTSQLSLGASLKKSTVLIMKPIISGITQPTSAFQPAQYNIQAPPRPTPKPSTGFDSQSAPQLEPATPNSSTSARIISFLEWACKPGKSLSFLNSFDSECLQFFIAFPILFVLSFNSNCLPSSYQLTALCSSLTLQCWPLDGECSDELGFGASADAF
jgi:hypothetical protein